MTVATQVARQSGSQTAPDDRKAAPEAKRTETHCEILRRDQYGDWDTLVDLSPHGTVFHYSWWLGVTANDFQILGIWSDGVLVGGIPLPRSRKSGLDLLHSPALTPYLGPIFDLSTATSMRNSLHLMRFWGESLARSIPRFDSFRYTAGAVAPDLQGFLWAGFRVGLAYTFRFAATSSLDSIVRGMTRAHAQKLTKAARLGVTVSRDEGIAALISLNEKTFARQGIPPPYSSALVQRLWVAAHARDCAHCYVARTAGGTPVAAVLTFNDKRTTYQIVSGVDWEWSSTLGGYVALWQAIQDALLAGRVFDFEGSALRGVETYYRRWGPAAVPVWRIEKAGSWRGMLAQFLIARREGQAAPGSSSEVS
jgi:hypothetical protein